MGNADRKYGKQSLWQVVRRVFKTYALEFKSLQRDHPKEEKYAQDIQTDLVR